MKYSTRIKYLIFYYNINVFIKVLQINYSIIFTYHIKIINA